MKTPAPFYEGRSSLFIICKRAWHFVQYNVSYHRLIYYLHKYEELSIKWFTLCVKKRECLMKKSTSLTKQNINSSGV